MRYAHVLICEANESDRVIFSKTLTDCYIDHCDSLNDINALALKSAYDAIFFGRSSIIEFLDGETEVFEQLSGSLIADGLFMFSFGDDHRIQVKKITIDSEDYPREQSFGRRL